MLMICLLMEHSNLSTKLCFLSCGWSLSGSACLSDAHVYKQVLECLKTHGVQNPKRIHLDFELADIKAAKECYPDTELIGFDTHWKRNLQTHNGKCGLATFSNTDVVIQTFLRHLWSLSLVPEEDVVKV